MVRQFSLWSLIVIFIYCTTFIMDIIVCATSNHSYVEILNDSKYYLKGNLANGETGNHSNFDIFMNGKFLFVCVDGILGKF